MNCQRIDVDFGSLTAFKSTISF